MATETEIKCDRVTQDDMFVRCTCAEPTYYIYEEQFGADVPDNFDVEQFAIILQEIVGASPKIVALYPTHNPNGYHYDIVSESQWRQALERYVAQATAEQWIIACNTCRGEYGAAREASLEEKCPPCQDAGEDQDCAACERVLPYLYAPSLERCSDCMNGWSPHPLAPK